MYWIILAWIVFMLVIIIFFKGANDESEDE